MTTTTGPEVRTAGSTLREIATAVCAELQQINATVQGELLDGVASIVAGIREAEQPPEHQARRFDAIAASVRGLAREISSLFGEHQANIQQLQRAELGGTETGK